MAFLAEYGIFLAKTVTIVIAIILILAGILSLKAKARAEEKITLKIKKLNDHYSEAERHLKSVIQTKHEKKTEKKLQRQKNKSKAVNRKMFVLKFHGDMRASALPSFRREITAVLLIAQPDDRVLIKLESGGGLVNAYGLAASQIQRLRDANLFVTVAIDKIAASGGYMMACVANEIVAAPFSIIGSIGVVAQLPNFHKLLEKNHIEYEQITAGQYKRTISLLGENTREGRKKVQEEVNKTHELFKEFITQHRPNVLIDKVATGEHWFAKSAVEKGLIDKLQTSDDFLLDAKNHFDLFHIHFKIKKPLSKRLSVCIQNAFDQLFKSPLK